MASKDNLIYLEVSNSTGEGVSRLFEVALIEAAEAQAERDNKMEVEEADADPEEEESVTVAKSSPSRFCSII